MTGELRQALKVAIDVRVRELVAVDHGPGRCKGCGCDYDARTSGCKTCQDRHSNRCAERRAVRAAWFRRQYRERTAYAQRKATAQRAKRARLREAA